MASKLLKELTKEYFELLTLEQLTNHKVTGKVVNANPELTKKLNDLEITIRTVTAKEEKAKVTKKQPKQ